MSTTGISWVFWRSSSSNWGMSAPRPLPKARFLLTGDHFLSQFIIGLSALRLAVIQINRQTMAGRFTEPDVPRNYGIVNPVLEIVSYFLSYLLRQVGPVVIHS